MSEVTLTVYVVLITAGKLPELTEVRSNTAPVGEMV